jgi:hypothetical protein
MSDIVDDGDKAGYQSGAPSRLEGKVQPRGCGGWALVADVFREWFGQGVEKVLQRDTCRRWWWSITPYVQILDATVNSLGWFRLSIAKLNEWYDAFFDSSVGTG